MCSRRTPALNQKHSAEPNQFEPLGAIHSTKIFGLRFENLLVSNGSRQVERSRSIPVAKRVSHSFKMKNVGSLLLVLKLDDDFDGDINDIV